MPRPCSLCSSPDRMRTAAEMIAGGATDQAVADKLGGVSRVGVFRHRRNHIEQPAKAIVAAANKGLDARKERARAVAAPESDPTAAFIGLAAIAADLRAVHDRLERVAHEAETEGQRATVGALAGQQLKAIDLRGRMGGISGLAPPQAADRQQQPFILTISFRGTEERPEFGGGGGGELIDATPSGPVGSPLGGILALGDAPDAIDAADRTDATDEEDVFDEDV